MRDEDMPSIVIQAVAPDGGGVSWHFEEPCAAGWTDTVYASQGAIRAVQAERLKRRQEEHPDERLESARGVLIDGRVVSRQINMEDDW